jgi:hypothetical protein
MRGSRRTIVLSGSGAIIVGEELYSLQQLKEYRLMLTDGSVAGFDCFWFARPVTPECRITHLSVGPIQSMPGQTGLAPTGRIAFIDDDRRIIYLNMNREELTHGSPYRRAVAALKARPSYNSGELEGCLVKARGQYSGTVVNFIVDAEHWDLMFFDLDIGSKEVLVEPSWTRDIDLDTRRIRLDLPAAVIAAAPEYRDSTGVNRRYCEAIYRHFSAHDRLH